MNNTAKTLAKHCINPLCGKTDYTEFSTCRYCSFAYTPAPRQNTKSVLDNPMPLLQIGATVATIVAGLYLSSVFGHPTTGTVRSFNSRYSASVPTALVVFFSQKALAHADDDINSASFALGRNPRDYGAYVKRGDAYWTKAMMDNAMRDYTSAIAISPMSPDAYDKRAMIYDAMMQGDLANKDRASAKLYRK